MENFSLDRYELMETALKELGFTVDFIEKRAQKTVITVSQYEKDGKNPVFEQEVNSHKDTRE